MRGTSVFQNFPKVQDVLFTLYQFTFLTTRVLIFSLGPKYGMPDLYLNSFNNLYGLIVKELDLLPLSRWMECPINSYNVLYPLSWITKFYPIGLKLKLRTRIKRNRKTLRHGWLGLKQKMKGRKSEQVSDLCCHPQKFLALYLELPGTHPEFFVVCSSVVLR